MKPREIYHNVKNFFALFLKKLQITYSQIRFDSFFLSYGSLPIALKCQNLFK